MHGSLLPKYRGRVPVNWAVLHGERRNRRDAALHGGKARRRRHRRAAGGARSCRTTRRARYSTRSPSRPNSRSHARAAGTDGRTAPRIAAGPRRRARYFGGRKPEDGRIDWSQDAQSRSTIWCAPWRRPIPGAYADRRIGASDRARDRRRHALAAPRRAAHRRRQLTGRCGDGGILAWRSTVLRRPQLDRRLDRRRARHSRNGGAVPCERRFPVESAPIREPRRPRRINH